jgi:hypothetical protein
MIEDRRSSSRIGAGTHFPFRFVVPQYAARLELIEVGNYASIYADDLTQIDSITELGTPLIYGDPPLLDPSLHLSARTDPRTSQYFLKFLAHS